MKNRKTTSLKAVMTSVLSLVLCCSMLFGASYAWFTDRATTNVNVIQSGTLDVMLVDAAGNDIEGQTLSFMNANGETDILWEPNATFVLPVIKIKNDGNLALKYRIEINKPDPVVGAVNLQDVIEFSVNDGTADLDLATYENHLSPGETSGELTISGHMMKEAGNEYMDLTLREVSITVYATQYTEEFDSIDNQYDADATLDFTDVDDEDALFRGAAAGYDVTLTNDIDVSRDIVMAASSNIDGAGNTLYKDASADEGTNAGVLTTGGSISNITIAGSGANAEDKGFRAVYAPKMADDLTIFNATLKGTYALNTSGTGKLAVKNSVLNGWTSFDVDEAEFVDCEFTAVGSSQDGYELNTIRAYNDVVLTDCDFISPYIFSAGNTGITIEINHCTFAGEAITATNFAELFTIEAGDDLYGCTIIVDGSQVVFA